MQLPELTFPTYDIKIRYTSEGVVTLYDPIRKKWFQYTPEEWVRQHLIHHFLNLGYPEKSISVEKGIQINGLQKRFDVLIYHKAQPILLCECKAPEMKLSNATWHQAMRYNTLLNVPFLLITNGLQHATIYVNLEEKAIQIESYPSWDKLINQYLSQQQE